MKHSGWVVDWWLNIGGMGELILLFGEQSELITNLLLCSDIYILVESDHYLTVSTSKDRLFYSAEISISICNKELLYLELVLRDLIWAI